MSNEIKQLAHDIANCPELLTIMPNKLKTRELIEPLLVNGFVPFHPEYIGLELFEDREMWYKYDEFNQEIYEDLYHTDKTALVNYLKAKKGRLQKMPFDHNLRGVVLTADDMLSFIRHGDRYVDFGRVFNKEQRNLYISTLLEFCQACAGGHGYDAALKYIVDAVSKQFGSLADSGVKIDDLRKAARQACEKQ